jgi:hypothetical protein
MSNADQSAGTTINMNTGQQQKSLYIIAAIAAFAATALFRRWLAAEFDLLHGIGLFGTSSLFQPTTTTEWFALLHAHNLIGVLLLNGLDIVNYALVGLIVIGLYAALRNTSKVLPEAAAVLCIMGITMYFISNQAFVMLAVSRQYYSAIDEIQKAGLLSVGLTLLTLNDPMTFGSGVFWAFIMVNLACLFLSIAMLEGRLFTRTTAIIGIIANGLGLGYFFTVAFAPALTFIPLSSSAPLLIAWYILIGIRLLRLSRPVAK